MIHDDSRFMIVNLVNNGLWGLIKSIQLAHSNLSSWLIIDSDGLTRTDRQFLLLPCIAGNVPSHVIYGFPLQQKSSSWSVGFPSEKCDHVDSKLPSADRCWPLEIPCWSTSRWLLNQGWKCPRRNSAGGFPIPSLSLPLSWPTFTAKIHQNLDRYTQVYLMHQVFTTQINQIGRLIYRYTRIVECHGLRLYQSL